MTFDKFTIKAQEAIQEAVNLSLIHISEPTRH